MANFVLCIAIRDDRDGRIDSGYAVLRNVRSSLNRQRFVNHQATPNSEIVDSGEPAAAGALTVPALALSRSGSTGRRRSGRPLSRVVSQLPAIGELGPRVRQSLPWPNSRLHGDWRGVMQSKSRCRHSDPINVPPAKVSHEQVSTLLATKYDVGWRCDL